MTDVADRLDSIRERVEAATEGPWKRRDAADGFIVNGDDVVITHVKYPRRENGEADSAAREANADLLASARSDVPYLLSLVEDVGRALAQTDQRTVYAFLDRVEEDVGQESVEALAKVRDAALQTEGEG